MADVELGVVREGISGALQELNCHPSAPSEEPTSVFVDLLEVPRYRGGSRIFRRGEGGGGGANGNAWPHDHGKGEGARERMELLPCVLNICS